MKWDNDHLKQFKHLIFVYSIAFGNKFRDRDASKISPKELTDLIDKFFEKDNETHKA
jgi:hypothetical protein